MNFNKLKRSFLYLNLALSKVEENALGQMSNNISDDAKQTERYRKGTLADDLIQGRITEEVKNLRARMYKVIEHADNLQNGIKPILNEKGEIIDYDITNATIKKPITNKIKGDPFDDYKIEMVINNEPITSSVLDTFDRVNKYGIDQINPILIDRDIHPKFEIEKYSKRLFVRNINDNEKLLEFYVSKYPDQYNRKTNLLISAIKKLETNPKNSDLIDINKVEFITYNDIGVANFKEFEYEINRFDKLVEYDGFYVIKFIATVINNGVNILQKYRKEDLDKKYDNKEFKGKL
jgi:hypothetical protein